MLYIRILFIYSIHKSLHLLTPTSHSILVLILIHRLCSEPEDCFTTLICLSPSQAILLRAQQMQQVLSSGPFTGPVSGMHHPNAVCLDLSVLLDFSPKYHLLRKTVLAILFEWFSIFWYLLEMQRSNFYVGMLRFIFHTLFR